MKENHPSDVNGQPPEEIARLIANLDHGARERFFIALVGSIRQEACGDLQTMRPKLGNLGLDLVALLLQIVAISARITRLTRNHRAKT